MCRTIMSKNKTFLTVPEQHFEPKVSELKPCWDCDLRGSMCLENEHTGCKTVGGKYIYYKLIKEDKHEQQ